jgi:hypothetical protein
MSVGKTCDDGTIAIFTQSGVTVHKDTDVLITCQGEPLLIGARDAHGRYRIPLTQHKGQWQPRRPSKKARQTLRHANSVYDLPSTEQAIRWMHAVCGYPVKSTWLKAIQAGNFIGWPLLTARNIQKYFPETVETPKGHLNQSGKNVRSTKQKHIPLETFQSPQLIGRKLRDVYVGPHTGTVPVLALGPKILPVVELGVFLPVVAPCVEFFCRCHNGVEFCLR